MSAVFQEDASANQGLIDTIVQTVLGVLDDPTKLPQNFKGWLPKYLEVNPPLLPISQISGFTQFTAQTAQVVTAETTTSTSFVDLDTVGPHLMDVSGGQYVALFGALSDNDTVGDGVVVGLSINGATPASTDQIALNNVASGKVQASIGGVVPLSLGTGSNTLSLQYRAATGGIARFQYRYLTILKTANS